VIDGAPEGSDRVSSYEVPEPILNSPFEEPALHWRIAEGEEPRREPGRRPASYFYRPPGTESGAAGQVTGGTEVSLVLVNRIRDRVQAWRDDASQPYSGVSRTTRELIEYWRRDGRQHRLFFAQLEAVETMLFLVEARPDLRQGIDVPLDEPSDERQAEGYRAFRRYACKMATGSGKTTVMGMLAAWSILNKVADRGDARFSDVVLVVCPNVTIRNRLQELDPLRGEASLYRTRDLVPGHMMQDLAKGRVLLHNWHAFEPQGVQTGGVTARVNKAGRAEIRREIIHIGARTTNARGKRYLTAEDLDRQMAAGLLTIRHQERDADDNLVRVEVEAERYVESDTSVVNRVLGRDVGGKQNILVMNDEAHHAYRIRRQEPADGESDTYGEEDEADWFFREATVWVDGLDRIHKLRGINFCLDLSATPYFLGRVGQDTNRPFPWVVSDFGLIDAIESGLVKVPQLAVRDTSGDAVPGYFNIWRWVMDHLTPAERGGAKGPVKPEAVLKWAFTPIAMLGGLWEQLRAELAAKSEDPRPPVFIIVCKNTRLAKVVHDWLALDQPPHGVPPARLPGLCNAAGQTYTIRVDTKVVHETDTGEAKSDEFAWMRFTLDTVGRMDWPKDGVGRPIYPPDFEPLAEKLGKPLHPPGRDVRCIVSVGMLTEGWDCNTVTHIIGLRPFTSQLLCEQVVGRGLRRTNYEVGDGGLLREEVAKILGVPFEVIPFKQNQAGPAPPPPQRHHVTALPGRKDLEIRFPRVEGYRQAIRNRVTLDWKSIAPLRLDPMQVPPEIQMKAHLPLNQGRPSVFGPGALEDVTLNPYRRGRRLQELSFLLAKDLTRAFSGHEACLVPPHVLFPQIQRIADRYLRERVEPVDPAEIRDVFMSPYYGWVIERLIEAIRPDTTGGEEPELPRYESNRGPGTTADVDFWTSKDVREVVHSHLNYVVADTGKWEQSAAQAIDAHPAVHSFAKNAGLGFAVPYLHNGRPHDYVPDFIVRLKGRKPIHVIVEIKGFDPLKEIKQQAAERWVAAVNAEGSFGAWRYGVAQHPSEVKTLLARFEAEGS
jgi:type III restriction enzyme